MSELIYIIGVVGLFRFLIYAIGEPHYEFNPRSILSFYSYYICLFRLKSLGINEADFNTTNNTIEEKIFNREAKMSYVVERCRPIAGWVNMLGLCPTCTSFWFMLLFVYMPTSSIIYFGISLLISKIVIKWT